MALCDKCVYNFVKKSKFNIYTIIALTIGGVIIYYAVTWIFGLLFFKYGVILATKIMGGGIAGLRIIYYLSNFYDYN